MIMKKIMKILNTVTGLRKTVKMGPIPVDGLGWFGCLFQKPKGMFGQSSGSATRGLVLVSSKESLSGLKV